MKRAPRATLVVLALLVSSCSRPLAQSQSDEPHAVPAAMSPTPRDDGRGTPDGREIATLGGGCFWCVEAVFSEVEGVEKVTSGYAGGFVEPPTYEEVCSGGTGHAEVVQVQFDPKKIAYHDILTLFLATHDPTTLNRQGADVGTQYRSVIFYDSPAQHATAERVKREMQPHFDAPIITEISPLPTFWPAEDYHQDYYALNPNQGYCRAVISPKLAKFRKMYQSRLKKKP